MGLDEKQTWKRIDEATWERVRELVASAEAELCNYGPLPWGANWCDDFTAVERIDAARGATDAPEEYYATLRELEARTYEVARSLREDDITPEMMRANVKELEDILGKIDRLDLSAIEDESWREVADYDLEEAGLRISRAIHQLQDALRILEHTE